MVTLLTFVSAVGALTFLAVVALALVRIVAALESIGGRGDSYLTKLRFGLRAIERETGHLPAAAPTVNAGLAATATGLMAVNDTLGGLREALEAQEART
ncbi:MAG: hypothetical protein ACTS3R_21370 [Inquilinaceae bacterium]